MQWEGYDAAWDMWVYRDVLVDDVPHMVTAYHKLGGLPVQPRRGAPKRASVGRLLLSGEVAFPPVPSCVVAAPPVCVRATRRSAQVSVSCVLSSRSGVSADQAHERAARVGRRGGLQSFVFLVS